MMPGAEADHTNYLYVSAENAEFANTFGGAQVVEVVVRDPVISETTEAASGMPKVEINGDKFMMTQGSDGAWYGYTADSTTVTTADALGDDYGLEYGTTCTSTTATTALGQDDTTIFDDVEAVWVSAEDCSLGGTTDVIVVGGAQAINKAQDAGGAAAEWGNVGISTSSTAWPFIQVYDFDSAGPVEVCYMKAGATECVLLDYDDTDSVNSVTQPTEHTYPPGAQVELEIRDMMLNIDPTSVDIWTFDIGDEIDADSTYTAEYANYRDSTTDEGNTAITMSNIGFDDGGVLKLTMGGATETVLDLQDNADQVYVDNNQQVTMTETSTNTGVFFNVDDAEKANILVRTNAVRGTVATVDYNDTQQSIVVGYNTASIDFVEEDIGDEWNSGETMTIWLYDDDRNLNSTDSEKIRFSEEDEYIPTIHVGTPLTLNWNCWR